MKPAASEIPYGLSFWSQVQPVLNDKVASNLEWIKYHIAIRILFCRLCVKKQYKSKE